MLSLEQEDKLKRHMRITTILWGAFCFSLILYGVFVYIYMNMPKKDMISYTGDINLLVIILSCVSFTEFLASFFIGKLIAGPEKIVAKLKSSTPENPLSVAGILQTSLIITLAFRETPAIFGLFLFLISNNPLLFVYFAVPSFFFLLISFPSFNSWKAIAEEVLGLYPEAKISMVNDTPVKEV